MVSRNRAVLRGSDWVPGHVPGLPHLGRHTQRQGGRRRSRFVVPTSRHAGHTPGDFFPPRVQRNLTCCLKLETNIRSRCAPLNLSIELAICNSRCEICCCSNDSSETRSSRRSGSACRVQREKKKRSWLGDGSAVLRNVHPLKRVSFSDEDLACSSSLAAAVIKA